MNQEILDLNEIKARAQKATKGPWKAGDCKPYSPNQTSSFSDFGADILTLDDTLIVEGGLQDEQGGAVGVLLPEDADFIAHARDDIPALIAEVERLRKILVLCRDCLDSSGHSPDMVAEIDMQLALDC